MAVIEQSWTIDVCVHSPDGVESDIDSLGLDVRVALSLGLSDGLPDLDSLCDGEAVCEDGTVDELLGLSLGEAVSL